MTARLSAQPFVAIEHEDQILYFGGPGSPSGEEMRMNVLHPRCGGLDVHKRFVTACCRIQDGPEAVCEVREFGTTTLELLALSDWLEEQGWSTR